MYDYVYIAPMQILHYYYEVEILCKYIITIKQNFYVCYNRDQMVSGECDVVTGFHVEDWEQHIIVLEGLRAGGIHSLWQQLPHHSTQGEGMAIIHILDPQ